MFTPDQYQLIDFGYRKKLERFSGVEVLRDCPAAAGRPKNPKLYRSDDLMAFDRESNQWTAAAQIPEPWHINHGTVRLGLKPTPFGHVGAFCEQAANWHWLDGLSDLVHGRKAINLFAYTGGTSLKLASLGASVVHVDSAKNVVNWARENASNSGLAEKPIRWIVDDALTFVRREAKRGNKYDIIVADPPAFGHGGKKASWKLQRDLPTLIELLQEISMSYPTIILFTWHSQGVQEREFCQLVQDAFELNNDGIQDSGPLDLESLDGRKLNCGHFFRWHAPQQG